MRQKGDADIGRAIVEIGIFSSIANVLVLVTPLYLLQVYDRVLASNNINTLIYISALAALALVALGLLEAVRSLYASRVAARLDAAMGSSAFLAALRGSKAGIGDVQPLRDLASVRSFVLSRAIFSLFDLPFTPLFIALLYLIHPVLFYITAAGCLLLVAIAVVNQHATSGPGRRAGESLGAMMNLGQFFSRNYETLRALGMQRNVVELWGGKFVESIEASGRVARVNANLGSVSRTMRIALQLVILGVGAYLVLSGEMTAGMIFASAIVAGRALQPLDQMIGGWNQFAETGRAWKRLRSGSGHNEDRTADRVGMRITDGGIAVTGLVYHLPGAPFGAPPLMKGLSFRIEPGETVALIGPNRAGKSTLARLLVGAIRPNSGEIRIDGADIANWDQDELGRHLGYLPQDVELFPGTIAQNISRFDPAPDEGEIAAAAEKARCHGLILAQRNGYETPVGPEGLRLSGGERQRIGLARAFYRSPHLIVLDEPNSNLDTDGEEALQNALLAARQDKVTVVLITHRRQIAEHCDRIMVLRDGAIDLYGPAREIAEKLSQGEPRPQRVAATMGESRVTASFAPLMRATKTN